LEFGLKYPAGGYLTGSTEDGLVAYACVQWGCNPQELFKRLKFVSNETVHAWTRKRQKKVYKSSILGLIQLIQGEKEDQAKGAKAEQVLWNLKDVNYLEEKRKKMIQDEPTPFAGDFVPDLSALGARTSFYLKHSNENTSTSSGILVKARTRVTEGFPNPEKISFANSSSIVLPEGTRSVLPFGVGPVPTPILGPFLAWATNDLAHTKDSENNQ